MDGDASIKPKSMYGFVHALLLHVKDILLR